MRILRYDGQLAAASIGIDAAQVRWFAFGWPDTLDNGLVLCVLHHKLFDLGVFAADNGLQVCVSAVLTARTEARRAVYALHGRKLTPRPGTVVPAAAHVARHAREARTIRSPCSLSLTEPPSSQLPLLAGADPRRAAGRGGAGRRPR